LVKQILIGFDKVLAVSEVSKEELIKMGIAVGKLAVHPNWIDTDIFKPINQDRSKFEKNVLFGVGRLIEKKGILLFLEAATLMPEINFHVVGGGPLEDTVKDYAQKNPNIKFYGVLMQNEPAALEKMVNLYSMCDYLVSPYLYDEGFSTTLIESLACGTPVLISDRGSPPTFLSKEVAYFLPAKPTAKDIVEYLNYLYKNPEIFNREKCTKYANDKFGFSNADTIVNEYLS
jgi:glycosyltransferase involved in cell wall biosynthesis